MLAGRNGVGPANAGRAGWPAHDFGGSGTAAVPANASGILFENRGYLPGRSPGAQTFGNTHWDASALPAGIGAGKVFCLCRTAGRGDVSELWDSSPRLCPVSAADDRSAAAAIKNCGTDRSHSFFDRKRFDRYYGRRPRPPSRVKVSPFMYLKSGLASCTQTRPISSSVSA